MESGAEDNVEWAEQWEEGAGEGRRQTKRKGGGDIALASKFSQCAEMFDRRIGNVSRLNRWSHCSCRLG